MGKVFYAKELASKMINEMKEKIISLNHKYKKHPTLAVILVGEDPSSKIYVNIKIKKCQNIGLTSELHHIATDTSDNEIIQLIDSLNKNDDVNGILVQLPLPKHLNTSAILEKINYKKDVDGFNPINIGKIPYNEELFFACTPAAVMSIIDSLNINVTGKNITIINNTIVVGKPLSLKLSSMNATITVCNEDTKDLKTHTQHADVLIVAAGFPKLITGDMCKENAVVIDIGINKQKDGTIIGDVDVDSTINKVSYLTAVPGGVGPLTVAWLLSNTIKAFELQN